MKPSLILNRQSSIGNPRHILSVALTLATLLLFTGCASTSPVDHAAKTLASTVATVDAAMASYSDLVALDVISAAEQVQVKKLYTDYQAAESVCEVALKHTLETHDASGLTLSLETLRAAQRPLLEFLARYTRPPTLDLSP